MSNIVELLNEAIRNPKILRRYEDQTTKSRKHRYERRKIRGLIHLGEWDEDEAS